MSEIYILELFGLVWFQASMVAEVEAARKSVDEERQRLSDRFAALERDKREQQAANRMESDRLAEEVHTGITCLCMTPL